MKQFCANTYFSIIDEAAFSAYVSERVRFWTHQLNPDDTDHNPVEMAIGEAIQRPDLVFSTGITAYRAVDYDKLLASHRAQFVAPDNFRAMFAEV